MPTKNVLIDTWSFEKKCIFTSYFTMQYVLLSFVSLALFSSRPEIKKNPLRTKVIISGLLVELAVSNFCINIHEGHTFFFFDGKSFLRMPTSNQSLSFSNKNE